MVRPVSGSADLKTAVLLSASFAILVAIAIPFLLEVVPSEQRMLPLSLPWFCLAVALQAFVIYGLLSWAGLRMARTRGLQPAPLLTSLWSGQPPARIWMSAAIAFGTGIVCGALLVAAVSVIQRLAPQTLPPLLHPPSLPVALLASAAASIGEEVLCRLFLLSLLLRLLPGSPSSTGLAVVTSALLFGAAHAPSFVFLFGGLPNVPPVSWVWLIGLNGFVGIVYGVFFIRCGIGAAALAHFGTDLVWHVVSQLFRA